MICLFHSHKLIVGSKISSSMHKRHSAIFSPQPTHRNPDLNLFSYWTTTIPHSIPILYSHLSDSVLFQNTFWPMHSICDHQRSPEIWLLSTYKQAIPVSQARQSNTPYDIVSQSSHQSPDINLENYQSYVGWVKYRFLNLYTNLFPR